jgi:hypothetical protein
MRPCNLPQWSLPTPDVAVVLQRVLAALGTAWQVRTGLRAIPIRAGHPHSPTAPRHPNGGVRRRRGEHALRGNTLKGSGRLGFRSGGALTGEVFGGQLRVLAAAAMIAACVCARVSGERRAGSQCTWWGRVVRGVQWVLLAWLVAAPVVAWRLDGARDDSSPHAPSPLSVSPPHCPRFSPSPSPLRHLRAARYGLRWVRDANPASLSFPLFATQLDVDTAAAVAGWLAAAARTRHGAMGGALGAHAKLIYPPLANRDLTGVTQ